MSAIHAARSLAPEFSARAPEAESLRTMPADLVAKVRRAGLFRIGVPRALGGLELDPVSIIETVEEVSRADGSAGWTTLIGNATAFFAWLEPDAVAEMFAGATGFVSTGVWGPQGRAVRRGDFLEL